MTETLIEQTSSAEAAQSSVDAQVQENVAIGLRVLTDLYSEDDQNNGHIGFIKPELDGTTSLGTIQTCLRNRGDMSVLGMWMLTSGKNKVLLTVNQLEASTTARFDRLGKDVITLEPEEALPWSELIRLTGQHIAPGTVREPAAPIPSEGWRRRLARLLFLDRE